MIQYVALYFFFFNQIFIGHVYANVKLNYVSLLLMSVSYHFQQTLSYTY